MVSTIIKLKQRVYVHEHIKEYLKIQLQALCLRIMINLSKA